MSSHGHPDGPIGIRRAAPVFPVRDLDAAMRFYARLGFSVRRYDAGYGFAERERLQLHLRAAPELEPYRATPRCTSTPRGSTNCMPSGGCWS